MHYLDEYMDCHGGVVPRHRLVEWGNTETEIRAARRVGALVRVRNGWYATPDADPEVLAAVRAGGALSCVSVLRRHGVWSTTAGLHLRPGHDRTLRPPRESFVCPCPGLRLRVTDPVDDLVTALRCASRCADAEGFLVLLESVVNLGLLSIPALERLFVDVPLSVQKVVGSVDRAESGTETLVRSRLRARGIAVRPQVWIGTIGRVDLLVGSSLVIEVDSRAHHTDLAAYESDRIRDRRLRALGYTVVRLTYDQILNHWPEVEADLLHMVRRGAHRRRVEAA